MYQRKYTRLLKAYVIVTHIQIIEKNNYISYDAGCSKWLMKRSVIVNMKDIYSVSCNC